MLLGNFYRGKARHRHDVVFHRSVVCDRNYDFRLACIWMITLKKILFNRYILYNWYHWYAWMEKEKKGKRQMGGWMDFWFDWFLAIAVYWIKNQNTCRTGQQKDAVEIYQNNGSHVELLRLLIGRINGWLCFIFKLDVILFPYLVDVLSFQDSSLVTDGLSNNR